jgi:hypothetical protein
VPGSGLILVILSPAYHRITSTVAYSVVSLRRGREENKGGGVGIECIAPLAEAEYLGFGLLATATSLPRVSELGARAPPLLVAPIFAGQERLGVRLAEDQAQDHTRKGINSQSSQQSSTASNQHPYRLVEWHKYEG